MAHGHRAARVDAGAGSVLARRATESPEWKRDLEVNYQSDEFLAGAELDRALDALYAQLKPLLTELDLAKKP
jgi:tripartite-type tricarboxylate transporter receptor subunit TctC